MRMSWKLGRVAGIDLFLHPTFLLVFLFTGVGAIPLVLALFGCVVLHELGHALMARRFGIETEDITLYPIGGVARLRRMPLRPGAELLIALAGPAVNFCIIAALIVLQMVGLANFAYGSWLDGFVENLILVNLVLGLFNLIPAFPMDGGRVLRALLSGWLGRARATSIAASLGRVLAPGIRGVQPVLLEPAERRRCRVHLSHRGRRGGQRPCRGTTPRIRRLDGPGHLDGAAGLPLDPPWQRHLAARPDRRFL